MYNEEPITKNHWMYRLACRSCDEIKREKVKLQGPEIKPVFSIVFFTTLIFLLLKNGTKTD